MRITILIVVFAALFYAGGAPGAELSLKEKVNASGDVVLLEDFFDGAGDAGATPLFRSPRPGRFGMVRVGRLVAAARRAGHDWAPPTNLSRVRVTREMKTVYRDEVAALIRRELAGTIPDISGPEDLEVDLPSGFRPVAIIESETPGMVVSQLEVVPARRAFRARVRFGDGDGRIVQTYEGRFRIHRKVPVLTRNLARGDIVMFEDVAFERMDRRAANGAMTETDRIIGQAARRSVAAGVPLRDIDFESPRVVSRNQLVTISYRIPGMTLTSRGRAIRDAAVGESVSVINLQSSRTIEATATGPGQVTVADFGPGPQLAENN